MYNWLHNHVSSGSISDVFSVPPHGEIQGLVEHVNERELGFTRLQEIHEEAHCSCPALEQTPRLVWCSCIQLEVSATMRRLVHKLGKRSGKRYDINDKSTSAERTTNKTGTSQVGAIS